MSQTAASPGDGGEMLDGPTCHFGTRETDGVFDASHLALGTSQICRDAALWKHGDWAYAPRMTQTRTYYAPDADFDALRAAVAAHPALRLGDVHAVRAFMRLHVFAVWDFMSLVTRLETLLVPPSFPWRPHPAPEVSRFVRELVTGETVDVLPDGRVLSHFELYRQAMSEVDADAGPIDRFLGALRDGFTWEASLRAADVPPAAAAFVTETLTVAERNRADEVAAALLLGREEPIPAMFQSALASLPEDTAPSLRLYLERHIELDSGAHVAWAGRLLEHLVGQDPDAWTRVYAIGARALKARLALYDAICASP